MAITRFNTNEVRQIIWVKRGDLEDWIREGYVVPSHYEDSACGKRYLWSREDIYQLAAFKKLVNSGLKPIDAHEALIYSVFKDSDGFHKIKGKIDNKIEVLFGK